MRPRISDDYFQTAGVRHVDSDRALKPFQITRKQLNALFNSPQQVKQMVSAGWITAVRPGKSGRETLFDFQSAERAFQRLKAGETPPMLQQRTTSNLKEVV